MKGLSWIVAASALALAPMTTRADNDPWQDTKPDKTQAPTPTQTPTQTPDQTMQDQTQPTDTIGQARLGVRVMDLTNDLRTYFAAPADRGLLIAKVEQDTAAQRAGLKAGDVLVSVMGQSVTSAGDVRDALSNVKPGDKISLDVIRNKKHVTLTAVVASDDTSASLDWMQSVLPWFDPDQLETPT